MMAMMMTIIDDEMLLMMSVLVVVSGFDHSRHEICWVAMFTASRTMLNAVVSPSTAAT